MGHKIVGVEFVQSAIEQFFKENNLKFTMKKIENFQVYYVILRFLFKIFFKKS